MKIQCNACEAAEASVLCCADEAALCRACDTKIHAANKLASKHQRVPLANSSSQMPKCDICQETTGYFFCLEDRALLCRKCDVAIHTANPYVSAHKRFLLTGVRVGLEPTEPVDCASKAKANSTERAIDSASKAKTTSTEKTMETTSQPLPKHGTSVLLSSGKTEGTSGNQPSGVGVLPVPKAVYPGSTMPGTLMDWPLEDFLGLTDFGQNYGFLEQGSSKADSANHGDSEWSPIYGAAFDGDLDIDECLGQVPQITPAKVPSPPTASGLYWPKNSRSNFLADNIVFVPDVSPSGLLGDIHQYQLNPADVSLKRRRMS